MSVAAPVRPKALKTGSLRAQILAYLREDLSQAEIATRLRRPAELISTMVSALRRDGHLPPLPRLLPGSLRARALEALVEAGGTGLKPDALKRRLGITSKSVFTIVSGLTKAGLAVREPDGLVLAAGVARLPPPTAGERFAAMAPLARIESYALTLAREGRSERAALFLRRAHDRLAMNSAGVPTEAVNLLVLADLIEAPEVRRGRGPLRTYGGSFEIVALEPLPGTAS